MNCERAVAVIGLLELRQRGFREGLALDVSNANGIEHYVDAAGRRGDGVGMRVDCAFVKDIEDRGVDHAAQRFDVACDGGEFGLCATGQEDARTFAREYTCRCAADGAAATVDDGDLADQQAAHPIRPFWHASSRCSRPLVHPL